MEQINRSTSPDSSSGPARRAVLEVQGARRSFGERAALAGVDLSVRSGEIYTLLGPNGAGKTSLVRAITGRLALEGGKIRILGGDPAREAATRRVIGLVPQEIALYAELTARENLEIFARLLGLGRADAARAADWALERVELSDRAGERVHALSGGMKRRLNIAAGVVHRPKLLLLDEPTVGVDPQARESLHALLRELRDDGLAVLLTTHDLEQAAELADVIGILIEGRVHAEGRPEELTRQVFGNDKELIVTLADQPTEEGRGRLAREGLSSARESRVWAGRLRGGLDDLAEIGARLAEAGLAVDELRVREPSLRGVFFHHAGRELEP